ncbi:hypothetical protein [Lentzea aerocolonigenes]|uniref:hypothetical protein n=1 Tax=Lentzea aerocolonigenes TaxID=68170 RepID=UPI000A6497E2|nr:hypothetical protein [Lentzea aerocolonigenes]MCP2242110.1 hypothetical protein [Lentzea aerocolonigenes]
MKHRRVFAGLFSVAVVMSVIAAPQAVAAECQYNRQDLPLPAGATYVHTEGSSTNNSRIVGSYTDVNANRALLWVNSTLRVLPPAVYPAFDVFPEAVNNTSVVVGRQETRRPAGALSKAFRFENGAYEFLETGADEHSSAFGVNDAGDVVGTVWTDAAPSVRTVVVWPRNGTRKSFGVGQAVGINAQRKIVMIGDGSGWVVDTDTGARIELPGARHPVVFDNDRVLNYEYLPEEARGQITEWDLAGVRVGAHRGGYQPYGRNGSGTVFGTLEPSLGGTPTLWRTTSRSPVVADRLPSDYFYAEITDAATLIGTYRDADNSTHPARWLWVCA